LTWNQENYVSVIAGVIEMAKIRNDLKREVAPSEKNRFLPDRNALSPIFATLIILAVVTILFIPVFIWATGTTSQTEESWETSGLIATERIVVEEASLGAGSSIRIYVRNIGKTLVSISDVIISGPDRGLFTYEKIKGELLTRDPVTGNSQDFVVQGELIEILITNLKGLLPIQGQLYTAKVFTTRGVGDTYQIVA
jgi:hypothetical protein